MTWPLAIFYGVSITANLAFLFYIFPREKYNTLMMAILSGIMAIHDVMKLLWWDYFCHNVNPHSLMPGTGMTVFFLIMWSLMCIVYTLGFIATKMVEKEGN